MDSRILAVLIEAAQLRSRKEGSNRFRKHLYAMAAALVAAEIQGMKAKGYIAGASTEIRNLQQRIEDELDNMSLQEVGRVIEGIADSLSRALDSPSLPIIEFAMNIYARLHMPTARDLRPQIEILIVSSLPEHKLSSVCEEAAQRLLGRRLSELFSGNNEARRAFCNDFVKWLSSVIQSILEENPERTSIILVTHDTALARYADIFVDAAKKHAEWDNLDTLYSIRDQCENSVEQLAEKITTRMAALYGVG